MKHILAVASLCVDIAKVKGFDEQYQKDMYLLGFVHDIGYAFGDHTNHAQVGADALKRNMYDYWAEVRDHGNPDATRNSIALNILNAADMSVDAEVNVVGFDGRLQDIRNRYGADSQTVKDCERLVAKLRGWLGDDAHALGIG